MTEKSKRKTQMLCIFLLFGMIAIGRAQTQTVGEPRMTKHATGKFEVTMTPQASDDSGVARMSIEKTYHGDLQGTGKGEMLSFNGTAQDSAGYVAMEKITGVLDGHKGTFVLQHSGIMTRGKPELSVTVVPDSATKEFVGLSGKMNITISKDTHSYDFEYTLSSKH